MSDPGVDVAPLADVAQRLSELLAQSRTRIVFAESCTGGLVAASLAAIPGISRWLCGSAVTYQEQTKLDWLAVSEADLRTHSAVSSQVTLAMALAVLRITTVADLAVAITGHLGPGAPPGMDAVVYIATAWRGRGGSPLTQCFALQTRTRAERQSEATRLVLQVSIKSIDQNGNCNFFRD